MGFKLLNAKGLIVVSLLTVSCLSVINVFTQDLGIIRLAIVVGLFIEVSRHRFQESGLPFAFVSLSVMSIVWGWLGPLLGGYSNPFAFLIFATWTVYCLNNKPVAERKFIPVYLISSVSLGIFCQFSTWNKLLTSLLWGYDNNAHLSALSQTYRHGGFLFSGSLPPLFSFSNYYNGYPPLQAGSWSFLLATINTRLDIGSESLIRYFCFFLFGTILTLCSLVAINIRIRPFQSRTIMAIYRFGIFLLVFFSQISFMFWMGFASFLWALTTLAAYLSLASAQRDPESRVIICGIGALITFYSYQLLVPIAIAVLVFETLRLGKTQLFKLIQSRNVWLSGIVSLVLMLMFLFKSLNTTDYIFFRGGIEPLALIPMITTVLIIAATWVCFRPQFGAFTVHMSAFAFAVSFYAILAFISKTRQDYVSYYPEKIGYSALLLGFIAVFSTSFADPRKFLMKYVKSMRLILGILVVIPLVLSFNRTESKFGFVSSLKAIDNLTIDIPFENCLIQAIDVERNSGRVSSERTSLILTPKYDTDVSTRWLSGVNGLLSDATYSISIPHSNATELNFDVVHNWLAQYPESHLTVLAAEEPKGMSDLGPRVDFKSFVCS